MGVARAESSIADSAIKTRHAARKTSERDDCARVQRESSGQATAMIAAQRGTKIRPIRLAVRKYFMNGTRVAAVPSKK